ncbi:alpha/beta fold hydrolase [Leptolyngbya sp. FACHB-261]|uniref:alpha/beta fold hydrolase n=1 Tax=Leptolyngbya sp. FACHB-261 TaxID=2692806 RepID=UPI0016825F91|nr:alpha/beta fold hydrolase [Leptolyngbya sp. FACHB-261]MBD2103257.1 alpha/beta fold hydrolase [Leptolyngbya sp. FACHB-261]
MAVVEERSIQVGALEWFYREAKPNNPLDRPPVLLLHGLPSLSYGWRHILPALAEQGFRAIAPDWIGFGLSAKPDRRDFAYTPDSFITALGGLLEALEIEQFSLVLQGFLGSVGLQYALRHPEQIERLAICNAPLSSSTKLPWRIQQLALPLAGEMLTQDPLLVDRTLEGGGKYQVAATDLDVYRRPFLKSSAAGRSLLATVRNLQLPKATAEIETGFAQWQHPTLLIWGLADPWLPLSMAEQSASLLQNAELAKLEEVGHYPQEDWHEKVSEVLLPFLRRQSI